MPLAPPTKLPRPPAPSIPVSPAPPQNYVPPESDSRSAQRYSRAPVARARPLRPAKAQLESENPASPQPAARLHTHPRQSPMPTPRQAPLKSDDSRESPRRTTQRPEYPTTHIPM